LFRRSNHALTIGFHKRPRKRCRSWFSFADFVRFWFSFLVQIFFLYAFICWFVGLQRWVNVV